MYVYINEYIYIFFFYLGAYVYTLPTSIYTHTTIWDRLLAQIETTASTFPISKCGSHSSLEIKLLTTSLPTIMMFCGLHPARLFFPTMSHPSFPHLLLFILVVLCRLLLPFCILVVLFSLLLPLCIRIVLFWLLLHFGSSHHPFWP